MFACLALLLSWCIQMAGGRTIQPISAEESRKYGLPLDTKVLLNARTTCLIPPLRQRAALALGCQSIEQGRKCMGVKDDRVLFTGSSCHGKSCTMELVPGPTACILTAYGVNIQTWNETRAETCGLDIDDSYWLVPFQNHPPPRDGSTNCITGLTEDISLLYWAPCIDGSPMLRSELSFPKHMGSNYSCLWNPQCLDRTFKSEIICYVPSNSSDVEVLKSAKGEAASQHRFIPPVFFIIFWCLFKDEYF